MKKFLIGGILVLALAGGAWYQFKYKPDRAKATATVEETAAVARGDLRVSVSSTGSVVSNLDVEVKCKAGGQVMKVPFDISDAVKEGDLLVELDPIDEQRKVSQAEVSLSVAQAKLAVARENLAVAEQTLKTDRQRADAALQAARKQATDARAKADRMKELYAKRLVSQEDADTAETAAVQNEADLDLAKVRLAELTTQERTLEVKRQEVRQAEATAQSDQITLDIAKDRLRDTKVLAPMAGAISSRSVQVGQIIASATSNVGGGTALLNLSDLSRLFVLANVDESDIGKVKAGQEVTITVDAYPGMNFRGKVVRIATTGVNSSNVVTFEVKIEVLSERKNLLKPQMTANVDVLVGQAEGTLLVPANALVRRGREYFAEVQAGGAKTEKKVEIGLTNGDRTEVKSGLAEGEVVTVHKENGNSKWVRSSNRPPMPPPIH